MVTGRPVGLINTPDDRRDLMQRLYGIRQVIIAPFDRAMMTMPWQDFIDDLLIGTYGAVHLVAGHDYHFGHRNQGDPDKLLSRCRERGIGCDIIPQVTLDGITVSSTYIRRLVSLGQVERAMEYPGPSPYPDPDGAARPPHRPHHRHPHGESGAAPHVLVPGDGVYIARVCLMDGSSYAAVTNVGTRPTVNSDESKVTCETFIPGFTGDLYGTDPVVEFHAYLSPSKKFDTLDELRECIDHAAQRAQEYFEE